MASALPIKCNLCHKSIKGDQPSILALHATWHKSCFRCAVCKLQLEHIYYSRKKKLFCRQHFLTKYGHSCQRCHKKITGLVMITGDVSFHPECFRCLKCRRAIGFGDDYSFEERSELFCTSCYADDNKYNSKSKSFNFFKKNAIHQVNLNVKDFKQSKFHFKVSRRSKDAMINELMLKSNESKRKTSIVSIVSTDDSQSDLKTGDTILEINGIPVTGDNIDKLSLLLEIPEDNYKRVSVVVERTPYAVDNVKEDICEHCPQPLPATLSPAELALYQRNVSFFNFSLCHQRCNSDTTTEMKRKLAQRRKYPKKENSLDYLKEYEKLKIEFKPESKLDETIKERSNSLNELNNIANVVDKDIAKYESSLHRAQSVKVNFAYEGISRVFRPVDLIFGEVIGQGFFGDVYKVSHRLTGEIMVVKKLREIDPEAEEQFLKEVQVLKIMRHPNLLSFIGVMYKEKNLHIVIEYISGGTLRALLKHKFIEISWKQKLEISKDIASGMAYLHSQEVMHRDLKSLNVLIKSKNGRHEAIVADFGLATLMKESKKSDKNPMEDDTCKSPCISPRPIYKKRHTVVGSAYWMAPEMLLNQGYDETTDIFSYGIVMCEIISRLKATPDVLPRTNKFGLDVENFKKMIGDCPDYLLDLAATCCSMVPLERPPFSAIEKWLQTFLAHIEFSMPLPDTMLFVNEPNPIRLLSSSSIK